MELPDQELLCIMTMIFQKGKDAPVKCATEANQMHQRRPQKIMVSITKYELIEKPDKGVF
jgi:hypothetical protein